MPLIKPRTTQKHRVRHITQLFRENNETLFAYAHFIGEPTEYVLNQLIESALAKDKDYQAWREQNPDSCVPAPGTRKRRRKSQPLSGATVAAIPATSV